MADKIGVAILAAGLGKRMGVDLAKPLIPLMGKRLVDFSIKASVDFCEANNLSMKIGVVVGHQREKVAEHIKETFVSLHNDGKVHFPVQENQNGTADALNSYFKGCAWASETAFTLVLCADTPLITTSELDKLYSYLNSENFKAVAATFIEKNPQGYGRIVHDQKGKGFKIVEEKDTNNEEKAIQEVNSGLYFFETKNLLEKLKSIDNNNNSGEFYLTDVFGQGEHVGALCFDNPNTFLGVNSPVQLGTALHHMKKRINKEWQEKGVLILEPAHTYVEPSVELEAGVTIFPGCYLHGKTRVASGAALEPGCILKDSLIGEGVKLKAYSYLENANVGAQSQIGPYARLRPGANLGEQCKIGNFVEVKKADLAKDVTVSHLSYVGDATIGENVNIGCGFITCNYDGESKHQTIIGKNSFIGSDTQMIAPVKIGESAFVASGSTINQDVPDEGFALSRGRQVTKEKLASRFLRGKWAIKKED